MRRKRIFMLSLALLAPSPARGDEAPPPGSPCDPYYAALYAKLGIKRPAIEVEILKPEKALSDGRISLTKQAFYDPDAVYLGIANSPQAGTFHFYVVAGDHTFEASVFFLRKSQINSMVTRKGEIVLPKGAIFALNAGAEFRDRVVKSMQKLKDSRDLTCLHGVCRLFREAGVDLDLPGGKVRAFPFVLNLLNGKLSDSQKPLRPEQIRLFTSSPEELRHLLTHVLDADKGAATSLAVLAANIGLIIAVPVVIGRDAYLRFVLLQSPGTTDENDRNEIPRPYRDFNVNSWDDIPLPPPPAASREQKKPRNRSEMRKKTRKSHRH